METICFIKTKKQAKSWIECNTKTTQLKGCLGVGGDPFAIIVWLLFIYNIKVSKYKYIVPTARDAYCADARINLYDGHAVFTEH